MLTLNQAVLYSFIMGAVIFFTRLIPFLFFAGRGGQSRTKERFLTFIEKTAPPVAMMVLTAREIVAPLETAFRTHAVSPELVFACLPVVTASALCALLYITLKRNVLVSIFGSTIVYMVMRALLP